MGMYILVPKYSGDIACDMKNLWNQSMGCSLVCVKEPEDVCFTICGGSEPFWFQCPWEYQVMHESLSQHVC